MGSRPRLSAAAAFAAQLEPPGRRPGMILINNRCPHTVAPFQGAGFPLAEARPYMLSPPTRHNGVGASFSNGLRPAYAHGYGILYKEPFAKFARKRDLLSGRVVVPGKPMASQVQIPFEGVILQEHSAPISCPTPNFAKGSKYCPISATHKSGCIAQKISVEQDGAEATWRGRAPHLCWPGVCPPPHQPSPGGLASATPPQGGE